MTAPAPAIATREALSQRRPVGRQAIATVSSPPNPSENLISRQNPASNPANPKATSPPAEGSRIASSNSSTSSERTWYSTTWMVKAYTSSTSETIRSHKGRPVSRHTSSVTGQTGSSGEEQREDQLAEREVRDVQGREVEPVRAMARDEVVAPRAPPGGGRGC